MLLRSRCVARWALPAALHVGSALTLAPLPRFLQVLKCSYPHDRRAYNCSVCQSKYTYPPPKQPGCRR